MDEHDPDGDPSESLHELVRANGGRRPVAGQLVGTLQRASLVRAAVEIVRDIDPRAGLSAETIMTWANSCATARRSETTTRQMGLWVTAAEVPLLMPTDR